MERKQTDLAKERTECAIGCSLFDSASSNNFKISSNGVFCVRCFSVFSVLFSAAAEQRGCCTAVSVAVDAPAAIKAFRRAAFRSARDCCESLSAFSVSLFDSSCMSHRTRCTTRGFPTVRVPVLSNMNVRALRI